MNTTETNGYGEPQRLSFPEDETRYAWLPMLLEAYYIADQGIHEAVRREEKQGRALACRKGCSSCCRTHTTIPIYPMELVGLYWYVAEKLHGPIREVLKAQLAETGLENTCPFLVDGACAVHPVRPMACRHFNVFGAPCSQGEDPYYTRRGDVLTPIKKYVDEAFYVMLPFYGAKSKAERRRILREGAHHTWAKVLNEWSWASLLQRMQQVDG